MSAATQTHAHGEADHHGPLHHQFEDLDQQNETYLVGMWAFLVTEIMFFGALFLMYALYRWQYQNDFYLTHEALWQKFDFQGKQVAFPLLGTINTVVLLVSSFLMAISVHFAQLKERVKVLACLTGVQGCALMFLVIKGMEWSHKLEEGVFPGTFFTTNPEHVHNANLNIAHLFFGVYFSMTGLHGLHVIIGMVVIGVLMLMWAGKNKLVTEDYIPTEMIGLYWHFVDIVWIFLFPLFYLIPKPH
ncbi:MAG: cytochrome c oxidase subunit 3 [Fimbriimonas sp.]